MNILIEAFWDQYNSCYKVCSKGDFRGCTSTNGIDWDNELGKKVHKKFLTRVVFRLLGGPRNGDWIGDPNHKLFLSGIKVGIRSNISD